MSSSSHRYRYSENQVEEPLINISLDNSPSRYTGSEVNSSKNFRTRPMSIQEQIPYEHDGPIQPESNKTLPKRSDTEIALELAREFSLMDVDDLEAQHPLLLDQLNAVASKESIDRLKGKARSPQSLHPYDTNQRASSPARRRSPNSANRLHSDSSSSTQASCDSCNEIGKELSLCVLCTAVYCPKCWDAVVAHKLGRLSLDRIPHEKTNQEVANKIRDTLESKMTQTEQISLHLKDEKTTWFGVGKDEMNDYVFQDSGRYASLMAECSSSRRGSSRYPSLVAFVGQTGAGKSTLIKMLIELRHHGKRGPVPVVGSPDLSIPTSGDVHLYSDPETYLSDHPMLYADCEGLEGGHSEPFASTARHKIQATNDHCHSGKRTHSFTKRLRKKHHSSQREILWADTDQKCSREFFVTHLYPRLLYTFSDVVVFVLKNPRTIENVVERLIEWAAAALENSTNQPVLPHVIIALNASENSIEADQWEIEHATNKLMASIGEALSKPSLKSYAQSRSTSRREIRNAEDLLLSYYRSVRVVRIPTKGRPQLINDQVDKLYQEIYQSCRESRIIKRRVRMLFDADELQPYLQLAFDHFSSTLETPFDFLKAFLLHNPIPADFGGNITKLAIRIMHKWENKLDAKDIFKELSPMVASCIMLDAVRHKIKGSAESIFREHYINHCDDALEDFCDRHWPCEFSSKAGRCVNVRSGHNAKGHQLKNGRTFGASLYSGYFSTFSVEIFGNRWKSLVHHDLDLLLGRLREASNETESEEQTASGIHYKVILTPFFMHIGSSHNYISHSTCFSCLMAPPEHPLPCGHIFCTPCLRAFGRMRGKNRVEISRCPLWHDDQAEWDPSWPISLKPAWAGVRILTLDGSKLRGGVRAIAELEILRLIHKALGGKIPLHSFFDLIVGTSAGGIIALGLGVEVWSVETCMSQFKTLSGLSFVPRKYQSILGLGALVEAHFHSKYETRPLQKALENTFSDNYLFGGRPYEDNDPTKVAVVTTSAAGLRSVVLSNYNRISEQKTAKYVFQRPDDPAPELKIWEAARATSAAPTYYKPFPHEPSKEVYLDGGINHNNPVAIADSERKLLWPDMAKSLPDLFFSIGSGYCPRNRIPRKTTKDFKRRGAISNLKALHRIAVDHIESSLDAQAAWQNYMDVLAPPEEHKYRFQRFNVELENEAPPKLDDIDKMDEILDMTRQKWSRDKRIQQAAHLLVASSFYFEKVKLDQLDDDSFECTGYIQCRFPPGMQHIQELGRFLKNRHMEILQQRGDAHRNHQQNYDQALYFVVQERYRESFAQQVAISQSVLDEMILNGRFSIGQIKFTISSKLSITGMFLSLSGDSWDSISGFPRMLQQEDETSTVRQLNSSSSRQRTPSQIKRRGQWAGPESVSPSDPHHDTISKYSDPAYIVGNSTAASLAETMERFSSSTMDITGFDSESKNNVYELDGEMVFPSELPS